ncbi:MAG: hypothetical protein HYY30_03420 [Chloroflexi bacterium]|nr:hypothetical protein [Chloroflexota bacterium]
MESYSRLCHVNHICRALGALTLNWKRREEAISEAAEIDGRYLLVTFGVSAPVSKIEAYRAGSISRQELIRSVGFQGQSRLGIIETFGKGVTK